MNLTTEADIQQRYYAETAKKYNALHVHQEDVHFFALSILLATIDHFNFESVLDIGSGTGRALAHIKEKRPEIIIKGIEPVAELREVGYELGVSRDDLVNGDAMNLAFDDGAFDVVCEFGVLHHIKQPHLAVSEMLRVAKKAIFISDSNNFGQGTFFSRSVKQLTHSLGLWKFVDLIKTRGKGYTISEGDGLAYSYSVFNNFNQIKRQCRSTHLINTSNGRINPYRTADHIALLGIK